MFYPANGYRIPTPFWHSKQARLFDRSVDQPRFAAFHEPRVGKSIPMAATASYHYDKGTLRGVIAITWPTGGHLNWIKDAFPQGCSCPWRGLAYETSRSRSRSFLNEFEVLCTTKKLAVLSIPGDALISEHCRTLIGKFAHARKSIMVIGDEISSISNADARRTKIMWNIGRMPQVVMWRILDGTPTDKKGPLDYYAEFGFMGFDILGYENEVEFRNHYAEIPVRGRAPFWAEVRKLKEQGVTDPVKKVQSGGLTDGKRRRTIPGRDWWLDMKAMKFKNMDELWRRLDPVSDRCTYAEAFPDAEKQVFAKRYFELTDKQRTVYNEIEEFHRAEVDDVVIDASHHLTRILRLQQVASNYYPDKKILQLHEPCSGLGCDDCDEGVISIEKPLKMIDTTNPRIDALKQELAEGKVSIIWVRFRQDGEFCMNACKEIGVNAIRFFGAMSAREREANYAAFQEDHKADVIVAQWSRGARARRFDYADKHIAYSNQYSFRTRLQAQQRTEHGSKKYATSFIDIVGADTVDETDIIPALRKGMDVSTYVQRDERREWI